MAFSHQTPIIWLICCLKPLRTNDPVFLSIGRELIKIRDKAVVRQIDVDICIRVGIGFY